MIHGQPLSEKSLVAYAPILTRELRIYPPAIIKASGLKRIVLCSDLSFAGQRRNAIPDFGFDTLYLDAVRGLENTTYMRKVIHHEFFHLIDYKEDGKVYEDPRWSKLNAEDFRYGDGGRNAQTNPNTSVFSEQYPGFLNHYSTTGVEEDKAELFANLIVEPQYVARRCAKDPILQAKKTRLFAELEQFCSAMDAAFWRRISDVK